MIAGRRWLDLLYWRDVIAADRIALFEFLHERLVRFELDNF